MGQSYSTYNTKRPNDSTKDPNCNITDNRIKNSESSKQTSSKKQHQISNAADACRPRNCPRTNEPLIRCTPKEPPCPETPTQVAQQAPQDCSQAEKEVPTKPTRVECPLRECPPKSSASLQPAKAEQYCPGSPKPAPIRPQGGPCGVPKAARRGLSTWAKLGLAAIALFSGFAMYNIYFRDDCEDTCTCGCKPKDDEC
ncbi:uncharacterized protein LOC114328885 [Diabrotica virgifera virgifera]|uniref:Uncharacterized protein LOC114328885 n=1 Tax=Diabrotica virgifera virgifera TaxID=50390 RepID=A0A6P7FDA5_DIAVI|nr:uncharacterized protein LOC114328885 [Diabrotica virgifera virgifera]XP_050502300.1 uncharacterized protein LOC114328885 [Diabrotica virgifera virgifera]